MDNKNLKEFVDKLMDKYGISVFNKETYNKFQKMAKEIYEKGKNERN